MQSGSFGVSSRSGFWLNRKNIISKGSIAVDIVPIILSDTWCLLWWLNVSLA